MNHKSSSLLYFFFAALFLFVSPLLNGMEVETDQASLTSPTDNQAAQPPKLTQAVEEAEKWLFTFFGVAELRECDKNLQYLITDKLKDMIFEVFIIEKPVWSYVLRRNSDFTFSDWRVFSVTFSNHALDEAPSHLVFGTQRCRLVSLEPSTGKRKPQIIFTAPRDFEITKAVFSKDNSKLLILTEKFEQYDEISKKENKVIYEITLENFTVIGITPIEWPSHPSQPAIERPPHKILDITYLENDSIVVVTANKEVFVLGDDRKATQYYKDPFDKTAIAHVATIDSSHAEVFMFIAHPEGGLDYPFKMIRYNCVTHEAITLISANCDIFFESLSLTCNQNGVIGLNDWQVPDTLYEKPMVLLNAQTGERLTNLKLKIGNKKQEISADGHLALISASQMHGSSLKQPEPPYTSKKPFILHYSTGRHIATIEKEDENSCYELVKFNKSTTHIVTVLRTGAGLYVWKLNPLILELDRAKLIEQITLKDALILLLFRSFHHSTGLLTQKTGLAEPALKCLMKELHKSLPSLLKKYVPLLLFKQK